MSRTNIFGFFLQILLYYFETSVSSPLIGPTIPVKKGEFPFIVSLSEVDKFIDIDNHFCAGTLISKRHILTADHCMEGKNKDDVLIIACTLYFDCGQIYHIKTYTSYDDWKYFTGNSSDRDEEEHDIGIITLTQDVKNAQPAIISDKVAEKLYGNIVITAGWGFINEDTLTRPKSLLKAILRLLSPEDYEKYTNKRYGYSKTPQPQFFYTLFDPPVVLSSSDSGGPLVLRSTKELIGVNVGHGIESPYSLPITSSPPRYSSNMHTRISYAKHRQFIQEIISQDQRKLLYCDVSVALL